MDILGPFPITLVQKKFLLVAIDYFIKWVKTEALACITKIKAHDFIWKSIIYYFDLPWAIVLGTMHQFDNAKFIEFCKDLGKAYHLTLVGHSQSNGKVKVTNQTLLQKLKTRLVEQEVGGLKSSIIKVLWGYWTTKQNPTKKTPFKLAFKSEAIILLEIGLPSYRVEKFNEENNSKTSRLTWIF